MTAKVYVNIDLLIEINDRKPKVSLANKLKELKIGRGTYYRALHLLKDEGVEEAKKRFGLSFLDEHIEEAKEDYLSGLHKTLELCAKYKCDKGTLRLRANTLNWGPKPEVIKMKSSGIDQEYIHKIATYKDGKLFSKVVRRHISVGDELGFQSGEYLYITLEGKKYNIAGLVILYHDGYYPPDRGLITDHDDRNKLNNRRENLNPITQAENTRNASLAKTNTSGFTGVCKTESGLWRAYIHSNGSDIELGRFIEKEDAIKVRKKANKEYGFSGGHGDPLPKQKK